jgi:hypothetical protein
LGKPRERQAGRQAFPPSPSHIVVVVVLILLLLLLLLYREEEKEALRASQERRQLPEQIRPRHVSRHRVRVRVDLGF